MVISTVNQVIYNGDGVTTSWPFTFRIIDATDIRLILIRENGLEVPLTSDYYVDTVNNTVYYPGYAPGSEPPEANQPPKLQYGEKLEIYRQLPLTQEKDLGEKWPFFVIELALDKLTMLLQDIYGWVGRNMINKSGDGTHWEADGLPISNVGGPVNVDDVATKDYVDRILNGIILSGDAQIVTVDTVSQLRSAGFEVGQVAVTLGYYDINDGGASVYNIRNAELSDVDDGGSIIILDNGNVAELIVNDVIKFKQWGAKEDGVTDDGAAVTNACAYAQSHDIPLVKSSGSLLTSATITITTTSHPGFDFEFDQITYTGSDYAIIVQRSLDHYVHGNKITSTVGGGIKITNANRSTTRNNDINILEIVLPAGNANACVDVRPVQTGIQENRYTFQVLSAPDGTGWQTYIPTGWTYYSYEGEETISIAKCRANVGVNIEIQEDENNSAHAGTITGLTFLHLSVEGSTTGVRIKQGNAVDPNPPAGQDPGIKGIRIHNMRCAEVGSTTMFLDATGYLRYIFVYPASYILLSQWRLQTTYRFPCKIFGQIITPTGTVLVGENLCSANNVVYIEKRTNRAYRLSSATLSFSDMRKMYRDDPSWGSSPDSSKYDPYMYMPDIIEVSSSLPSATINLDYFFNESARDVYVSVAAGQSVTVNVMQGGTLSKQSVTITNSAASRHLYSVSGWRYAYYNGSTAHLNNVYARVADLGVYSAL